jgi:hypothetical protein
LVQYIKYSKIDFHKWDDCILQSLNALPYAYSWYLNIVTDNSWDAIVLDDYKAVFPLPVKKKFGLKKIYQPFFTQQLGLFYTDKKYLAELPALINTIPKTFLRTYLHLNTENDLYNSDKRITHHLALQNSYETIYHNFGTTVKKNLKILKEKKHLLQKDISVEEFLSFVKTHVGDKVQELKEKDFERLQKLISVCIEKEKGFIYGLADINNKLMAAIFILRSGNYLIYLIAASSPGGRKNQAMTYLINNIIEEYAHTPYILDFEGSMIPGIAHFYKTFGAKEILFPVIDK